MSDYPLIEDHGLIGDLQTTALVANDGTIDWFCWPRFDSPSVFASLLDRQRGGRFRIALRDEGHTSTQMYFPESAVLITRFLSDSGVGELVDFMPITAPKTVTDHHRIVRAVRCMRGRLEFVADCEPRFDYGRKEHQCSLNGGGATFTCGDQGHVANAPEGPARTLGTD